jgi:hypothetical protein
MEGIGQESVAGSAAVLPMPHRCFCHVPIGDLRRWARKRYVEHVPTMDLLAIAKTHSQKDAVGIVALLDLPDDEVIRMLAPLAKPGCHILACRDHVKQWLHGMLAVPN